MKLKKLVSLNPERFELVDAEQLYKKYEEYLTHCKKGNVITKTFHVWRYTEI